MKGFAKRLLLMMVIAGMVNCSPLTKSFSIRFMEHVAPSYMNVGPAGVWLIGNDNYPYLLQHTFRNPSFIYPGMHFSTGNDRTVQAVEPGYNSVWTIDDFNNVFVRTGMTRERPEGTTWTEVTGKKMQYISVDETDHVWAVGLDHAVYRRAKADTENPLGVRWKKITGQALKQISIGRHGVWGVDASNELYYRNGTYFKVDSDGVGWIKVGENIKKVAVGNDYVWCLTTSGELIRRTGINSSTGTGTGWEKKLANGVLLEVSGRVVLLRGSGGWSARLE